MPKLQSPHGVLYAMYLNGAIFLGPLANTSLRSISYATYSSKASWNKRRAC